MKWVELKIHLVPKFMDQINEVSKIYMSNLTLHIIFIK